MFGFVRVLPVVGTVFLWSFAGTANGALVTIDFEADTLGAKANGFTPSGISGVSFSDSVGAGLLISNAGTSGAGMRSLVVQTDTDQSALQIALGFQADFISLDFGNDDPSFTNAGDLAVLTTFSSATQVGQSTVVLNRDDLMNQTIIFGSVGGGVLFDLATFAYTNSSLVLLTGGGSANVGSIEVVDTIQINAVPLPASLPLFLSALAGLGLFGWRRRKAAA